MQFRKGVDFEKSCKKLVDGLTKSKEIVNPDDLMSYPRAYGHLEATVTAFIIQNSDVKKWDDVGKEGDKQD